MSAQPSLLSHLCMHVLPVEHEPLARSPAIYGKNITVIASCSLQGMGEALILDGAADASAFEGDIEQVLAPSLPLVQTVVMDNLSTHQGVRVRRAIEAKGCHLLFLPS